MKTQRTNGAVFVIACALVLMGFLAGTAHATNYPMGQQSITGFSSGTTYTNRIQGMYFTVLGTNVTVTQIGCITPLGTAWNGKLWTYSGTQLASVSIPAGTGWHFANLSTPVTLTQGSQYQVSIWGSADIYFRFSMTSNGWGGDSNIQNQGNRYSYNTSHTCPATVQASAVQGVTDIGYVTGPSAPASITVPASSTTGTYTVSWSSVSGATGYDLDEDTVNTFTNPTQVYSGPNTSWTATGKAAGTYYYRVRATNTTGNSTWTVGSNGCVVQVPPAAPSSITVPATSITGNYPITWSSVQGATGYDLQEDTVNTFTNPTQVYSGANTSFGVTGKTTGTFYYRVRATNTWGNSGWTAGTNGCQMVPPAAPASITVPVSSVTGSYTVSWSSSTGATGYDLEEDTSASFSNPISAYTGTNTTFNVTGKTVGTFYYRVRATGVAGSSGWTPGANGCQMLPPNPPSSITVPATSVTGTYTVFWTAEAGATSYDLEEATDVGFTSPVTVYSGSNISYNVTGKTAGTYYYRVRSVGVAGPSGWTPGGNGCQIVAPSPPVPLTVPATSTTGTYTVSWGASQGVSSYELQEDSSSGFGNPQTLSTALNLNYTVMGKPNGTYYYRVRASNGAGQSAWTTDMTGCTVSLAAPSAPASITVPVMSATGNFTVSWTAVTGGSAYDLEEDSSPAFTGAVQVYTGASTQFGVTGKANGVYYYRVRARNAAGTSGWTNGANGCTVTLAPPSSPSSLMVPASSSTGNFGLSWMSVSGNPSYELVEATDAGFTNSASIYTGPGTSFQVTGRTDGTYWYRVRAVNSVGSSGWTDGSNPCVVTVVSPALSVFTGAVNPGTSLELPGTPGVRMLHIRCAAGSGEDIRLLNLQVDASGTGDDSTEIVQMVLWRDVDGDGFAGAGDTSVGTGAFAGDDGSISLNLSSEPVIPAGGEVHYLAVCDLGAGAQMGSDFTFRVNVPAGVVCQGANSLTPVAPTGSAVVGGTKTIASSGVGSLTMSLGSNSPAPGTVGWPAVDAPMLQAVLSASSMEGVTVTRLLFAGLGEGDETVAITVKLYLDGDGDGVVSSGSTPLGVAVYAQDNGSVEFTGLNIGVPPGGPVVLLVTYDVADGGVVEGTYRVSLSSNADVTALGDTTHVGVNAQGAPLDGSVQWIVRDTGSGGAVYFMGGCAGGSPSPTGWAGYLLLLAAGLALIVFRRMARCAPDASNGVWKQERERQ